MLKEISGKSTMQRIATLVASLLLVLTACGPGGEPPAEPQAPVQAIATESPDDAFDRALDDLTRAFFFHSPELATKYGVSELVVPRRARQGGARRLPRRSTGSRRWIRWR